MAFGISILTAFGVLALYWKIRLLTRINSGDGPVDIIVDGYADQQSRLDGAPPLSQRSYQASAAALDAIEVPEETEDKEVARAYVWLKNNITEFSGAVDLL